MSKRGYASLIWGGLLIVLGLLLLAENLDLLGGWKAPIWSLILGAGGVLFLAIYIGDRQQWWALIPGLVFLGIAAAVFLGEQDLVPDYAIATVILAAVGLPFLFVFASDRNQWWALIPAFALAGSATGVFLEGAGVISDEAVASVIVGGVSLGFLVIYALDHKQWWALIPGGIMGLVAFFLLAAAAAEYIWPLAIILLGLLLLRRSLRRGRWQPPAPDVLPRSAAPYDVEVETASPEKKRLLTLEEQIAAAITDEPATAQEATAEKAEPEKSEATVEAPAEEALTEEPRAAEIEPPPEVPPAPEMPEPPEVPSPPQIE